MTTRRFFSCFALALAIIAAFNVFIALKVDSVARFTMRKMQATPQIDILFLGNSLIFSDLDSEVFAAKWPPPNAAPPIFNAGLGLSSPVEHDLLARQAYLHHQNIRCLVYGFFDLQMTARPQYGWSDLVGNRAMAYSTDPTVAAALYAPGSTAEKWRFNLIGAIPMLREHSQLWKFVELWRRELSGIGLPPVKMNQFGRVVDFEPLTPPQIASTLSDCEASVRNSVAFNPPMENLLQLARENKTQVVIVEMPVISDRRANIYSTAVWKDYRAYLQQLCRGEGAVYINASEWALDDADFSDDLHLNQAGAEIFSTKVAQLLAGPLPSN